VGKMKLAVTTVALPHLTLEEQIGFAARLGYDGVYFRVRDVPEVVRGQPLWNWGNHRNDLNPRNFLQLAPRIRQLCEDAGIVVAGVAGLIRPWDLDELRILAEGTALCGCPIVRLPDGPAYTGNISYHTLYAQEVENIGRGLEILKPFGVRGVLEIHGGGITSSPSMAHRLASNFPSEAIGIIFDVQNMIEEGYEGIELGLDVVGPYLAHVHIGGHMPRPIATRRDETETLLWTWRACDLADGLLNNRTLWSELQRIGYDGFLTVEDFKRGDIYDVEARYRRCIEYLRGIEKIDGTPALAGEERVAVGSRATR
jgi:sugar phosphate isomerase/epimerase